MKFKITYLIDFYSVRLPQLLQQLHNRCLYRVAVSSRRCTSVYVYPGASDANTLHRKLGQYGHDMIVNEDKLYVYGGVQGSLTEDVIGIDISSLGVSATYM